MNKKTKKKPSAADQMASLQEQINKLREDYSKLEARVKVLEARGLVATPMGHAMSSPAPEVFPRIAIPQPTGCN